MGASQSYYATPKPLYGSVRATSLGDLVTIVMEESITSNDNLTYSSSRESNTQSSFTDLLSFLPSKIKNNVDGFGGANEVSTTNKTQRTMSFKDSVAVQVVQIMPNGNLLVQGKKTVVHLNDRMDLLVSGIVDPRWIDYNGQVSSKNVANLQFAMSGKGSSSTNANDGIINRVIRYLF